jgi:hypothetical protein
MRPFDRDLIRGEHYGQRSCEPHQQAEHMAAPTNAALVKKVLANSEPSTHGPKQTSKTRSRMSAFGGKADLKFKSVTSAFDPLRKSSARICCSP